MTLLNGKPVAEKIKDDIAQRVNLLKENGQKIPHLAAILVGDNGASATYVSSKIKACSKVGFKSSLVKLPESISENDLLKEIQKLNDNPEIDGFIVQLPLPGHIQEQKVLLAIDPDKDVDGFHPVNFGKMALGLHSFIPATPYGILELLKYYNIETQGKHVVVIGRSDIVGRPISILLSQKQWNATVTLTHSHTQNLDYFTKSADIIIAAVGIPRFLKEDMIKKNVTVIDVGITRVKDETKTCGYSIAGDVDFESVKDKVSSITPVPGGVGVMTIAMLLKNTLLAVEKKL